MSKRPAAILSAAVLMVCGAAVKCGAQSADAREVGTSPSSSAAATSVPRLVQFNGTLKDTAARPVSGVASVTFAIYAEQDGGAALWSETQNVLADSNGHFNALLGTSTSGGFPSELFSTGQSRWLGVTIARQPEMPRVMLASVPYAMKAGDADTLGGLPASSYVTAQQLAARTAIASPSATVVTSSAAAPAGATSTADGATTGSSAQSVTQATITGTGTAQYLPLWTSGTNLGVSKIYQAAGGFVGINTNTPLLQLDVNGNSIFRGSFQMAPQGTATASAGQPSHSFQWQGSVYNSSTKAADNLAFGFRTVPDHNDVASPTTKLDLFYGPGGGTLNDLGLSIDHTGVITFVPTQAFTGTSVSATSITLPTNGTQVFVGSFPFIQNSVSNSNLYVGYNANEVKGTGGGNTGIGSAVMFSNTTGSDNTALGDSALQNNTTGQGNTAVGFLAEAEMTMGASNTGLGAQALYQTATGTENTAVGFSAGGAIVTGIGDTFVGYQADAVGGSLINATAIGYNARVSTSNAMVLGASAGTGANQPAVGIGTSSPTHTLEIVDGIGKSPAAVYVTTQTVGNSAVYGESDASSGTSNGGYFYSASPSGAGVVGVNDAGGLAASFVGNVSVTGTLTKGGGSFKIDDPIDPAGKYLSHSFVESPDMMNIYNGNVTTDAKGFATVSMPDWFEALNRDFRYQLTTINSFSRATVAAELKDGKFRIRTSQAHVKVSWQVTGIRHDAWANAHRIPNEEEKPGDEHGKYLHPELFGAGPDKQIGTQRGGAAAVNAKATPAATAGVPASASGTALDSATGRR